MWPFLQRRLQLGIPRTPYTSRREVYPGPTRGVVVEIQTDPLTCTVLLARGGVVRAPVAQRGSSVSNVSRWIPAAAQTNMVTGAAVRLDQSGVSPPPADITDLDGDIVLVDWIEGDIERPVITHSLEHPRGARGVVATPPVLPDAPQRDQGTVERLVAHQGTTARIDHNGNVSVDARRAGVANDRQTYRPGDGTSGVVDVALRVGGEVQIRGVDGARLFRLRVTEDGPTLVIGDGAERVLLAGPFIDHLAQWQTAVDAGLSRLSALWAPVNVSSAAADVAGAPAPINIPPAAAGGPDAATLRLPWSWAPPPTADATPGLKARAVQLDATAE